MKTILSAISTALPIAQNVRVRAFRGSLLLLFALLVCGSGCALTDSMESSRSSDEQPDARGERDADDRAGNSNSDKVDGDSGGPSHPDLPSNCPVVHTLIIQDDQGWPEGVEGCVEVRGNVHISGSAISRATQERILIVGTSDGSLTVSNYEGTSLDFLSALRQVKSLQITDNPNLESVRGINHLVAVYGDLTIRKNPKLSEIADFNSLNSILGTLRIEENEQLSQLKGFHAVKRLEEGLLIKSNTRLETLGILSALPELSGDFKLVDNPLLEKTESNFLLGTTRIDGSVEVHKNIKLGSLAMLENVEVIRRDLHIESNNAFVDLNGLGQLWAVSGALRIVKNTRLESLDGTSSLGDKSVPISHITITGNQNLCHGLADAFIENYGANFENSHTIENNKENC